MGTHTHKFMVHSIIKHNMVSTFGSKMIKNLKSLKVDLPLKKITIIDNYHQQQIYFVIHKFSLP